MEGFIHGGAYFRNFTVGDFVIFFLNSSAKRSLLAIFGKDDGDGNENVEKSKMFIKLK